MIRGVVKIDEELCNGCGECIPNCHEGALRIIDGKARLVSDLLCDGLGACVGHCPAGAITVEKREAGPYDEWEVIKMMYEKGENTVIAHMKHLKDHNEMNYFNQAKEFLKQYKPNLNIERIMSDLDDKPCHHEDMIPHKCPGSKEVDLAGLKSEGVMKPESGATSELRQWPVQLHLINPGATTFKKTDLLLAADCSAFASGKFHNDFLKGKALAIACPKLDSNTQIYVEKIKALIEEAVINTITVLTMEVPCCRGLLSVAEAALSASNRKVPLKHIVMSLQGRAIEEKWL